MSAGLCVFMLVQERDGGRGDAVGDVHMHQQGCPGSLAADDEVDQ